MTTAPISLQDLRKRIYVKAKAEPAWRFWGLNTHVCKGGRGTVRASAGRGGVGRGSMPPWGCSTATGASWDATPESAPSPIGHITLEAKQAGKRSAGNPHATFEEAGAGNGITVRLVRHSQRKRGATDRPDLRVTAPVLDPTCVQRRLACSAGDSPVRVRARDPVAWMAGRRETDDLKPIDKAIFGMAASHRAVTEVNADLASKDLKPRRSNPQLAGEDSMGHRNLAGTMAPLRRGESDSTVTRTRAATGEALLIPARNCRSKVGRITGDTGKSVEDERVAEGSVRARTRGNARRAKGPCCL
jgi:hypothetical protein